jgi:hypothetical protein
MKVYRIRDKRTQTYVDRPNQRVKAPYHTLGAAKNGLQYHLGCLSDRLEWFERKKWEANEALNYEIVEFDLVEARTYTLR